MKTETLYTWNVNGLRACSKKGFFEWLKKERPAVLCLQETKISNAHIDFFSQHPECEDYNVFFSCAQKAGYSGVAIYSRKDYPTPTMTEGLGVDKFDIEGRTLIAEYPNYILFCCYFPNGQRDHNRVPYKLEYCQTVAKKALELHKKKKKPILIAGDYNTAHCEIDLKNPQQNKDTTGFLPIERAWIDQFIAQGFVDLFRHQHPGETGQYTWWTYRGDCRQRNIGWRLDYFFSTKDFLPSVKNSFHCQAVMGSDHCPTAIDITV